MTFLYSFGELVGCSICGVQYKRPSVHQFVNEHWVNLDDFCDSYGVRRNRDGYQEANEFAEQMIEAEEKAFIIKHTLCKTQRQEQIDKAFEKIKCRSESANGEQVCITFCCPDLASKRLRVTSTAKVQDILRVLSLVYNIPCNQLGLYGDAQHKTCLAKDVGATLQQYGIRTDQRLFLLKN